MKKISCLMLMIFCLFILIGCKEENSKIEPPQDQPIEEVHQTSSIMRELNLLGMASIKEFKATTQPHKAKHFISNRSQEKELNDEKPTYVPGVTYPYDYVKIHSAMKFSIFIPVDEDDEALEAINNSCGLGGLRCYHC